MLAMDVVDTLRHQPGSGRRANSTRTTREKQLIDKLREIYHQQGIEVPDHILKEGVAALAESRFVYDAAEAGPRHDAGAALCGRASAGAGGAGHRAACWSLGLGGYFLGYQPYQAGQVEAARIELAEDAAGADGRALPDDLRGNQGAAGGRSRPRRSARRAARPPPPKATAPARRAGDRPS